MTAPPITVFFDFACPFSYVTLAALQERAAAGEIELRARALERFPPAAPLGAPEGEAEWGEEVERRAAELGLPLRAPGFRPRTRKAHEAVAFAARRGLATPMRSAIFAAYWGEARDIGRIDVLVGLGGAAGMDAEELRIALDIDQHADAVLHDEEVAARLRVARTPTLFVGTGPRARILVGAVGPAELAEAIAEGRRGGGE